MHYSELLKKIDKVEIEPVYLIYGEDRFLIDDVTSRLLEKTLGPDSRGFNYHVFDGGKVEMADVLDMAQSFPVLSSWRLILIRDINLIPAEGLDLLVSYIKTPSPTTCLVLVTSKPDMRKRFFQEIKVLLSPVQIQPPSGIQLVSWVRLKANGLGLTIPDEAISFIIERRGDDLKSLLNEIEKLSIYLDGKKAVKLEDVKAVICGEETPSIFELTGCICEKNTKDSLRLLFLLLTSGESPLVILSMIVRQFRIIWKILEAKDAGRSAEDILREIGIPKWSQGKLIRQSEKFTPKGLAHAFSLFLKTDIELKSSRIAPRIILEDLIFKLCSPL